MKLIRVDDPEEGTKLAAGLFAELSGAVPNKPVGLATGATMHGFYSALVDQNFRPQFSDLFLLDEYVGLPSHSPHSFEFEVIHRFCKPLHYGGQVHVPGNGRYAGRDGSLRFEEEIHLRGPLSVQLLGLGTNGHIAFNEPGSSPDSRTRKVVLSTATREANRRHFPEGHPIPTFATTQGLATINQARSLLLLAFGPTKAEALTKSLGTRSQQFPLSSLVDHPNLIVVTDIDTSAL